MDFLSSPTVSFFQADQAIYGCLRSRVPSVTQNGRHSGGLAGGRRAGGGSALTGLPSQPTSSGRPHAQPACSLPADPTLSTHQSPSFDPHCPWGVWKQEAFMANEGCFHVRRVISFPLQRALGVPAPESWAMFLPLELPSDPSEMRRHGFSPD